MTRIQEKLKSDKKLLSIYFTAGYPQLDDTLPIITELDQNGVDMIEIGLPFSDPLADGPTIQQSSAQALRNGMNSELLFTQLQFVRKVTQIPLLIMGYFNPILQYGVSAFCSRCQSIGIDGLIIPDLPLDVYQEDYLDIFASYGITMVFLITPQTTVARIRQIDAASTTGFIYMVSSASTTGAKKEFGTTQRNYFERIQAMGLKTPLISGFGISNSITFEQATETTAGGIIGSAFINHLSTQGVEKIGDFLKTIR